ncbi:hypothetical protein EDD17DRAFT_1538605 [Pisolithus thermaeus]|nr:hypothetical protein EDD17DRAFT_1538605 [Pisolithus thermaeus]
MRRSAKVTHARLLFTNLVSLGTFALDQVRLFYLGFSVHQWQTGGVKHGRLSRPFLHTAQPLTRTGELADIRPNLFLRYTFAVTVGVYGFSRYHLPQPQL